MPDRATLNRGGADPADALKAAGERLLGSLLQRAVSTATDRVGELSDRLADVAEDGGPGLKAALTGGKALAEGKSPVRAALGSGLAGAKEKIKNALGGGGGGGKKPKVTNIVEEVDIGLPLRTTYDLWTRFSDFPSFLKKVESVEQSSAEKSTWKAQVFWSHRSWEAKIAEQVPDSHIVWRSSGEKGRVDGAVTFTALGPNLTRVLVVLEYWPQGLFERTGNLWRAQGRRARLEIKHFRRHAMTHVLPDKREVEGWRGEIRDGEVVVSHEEAVERERSEADDHTEDKADDREAGRGKAGGHDDRDGDRGEADHPDREPADDDYADDYDDDYEPDDEYDPDDYDEYDDGPEDTGDREPTGGTGRRRRPVSARSGRER